MENSSYFNLSNFASHSFLGQLWCQTPAMSVSSCCGFPSLTVSHQIPSAKAPKGCGVTLHFAAPGFGASRIGDPKVRWLPIWSLRSSNCNWILNVTIGTNIYIYIHMLTIYIHIWNYIYIYKYIMKYHMIIPYLYSQNQTWSKLQVACHGLSWLFMIFRSKPKWAQLLHVHIARAHRSDGLGGSGAWGSPSDTNSQVDLGRFKLPCAKLWCFFHVLLARWIWIFTQIWACCSSFPSKAKVSEVVWKPKALLHWICTSVQFAAVLGRLQLGTQLLDTQFANFGEDVNTFVCLRWRAVDSQV